MKDVSGSHVVLAEGSSASQLTAATALNFRAVSIFGFSVAQRGFARAFQKVRPNF